MGRLLYPSGRELGFPVLLFLQLKSLIVGKFRLENGPVRRYDLLIGGKEWRGAGGEVTPSGEDFRVH